MVIDSNILIDYLNGEEQVIETLSKWKLSGRSLLISSISRAEILASPSLNPMQITEIGDFLEEFISISFDDRIADMAARLRRDYRIKFPDAGIAATALIQRMPLVTRDRQFVRVPELEVIEI